MISKAILSLARPQLIGIATFLAASASVEAAVVATIRDGFPSYFVFGREAVNAGSGLRRIGFVNSAPGNNSDLLIDFNQDGQDDVYLYGVSANSFVVRPLEGSEILNWTIPEGSDLGGGITAGDDLRYAAPVFAGDLLGPNASTVFTAEGGFNPPLQWTGPDGPKEYLLYNSNGFFPESKGGLFTGLDDYPFIALRFQGEDGWHYAWVSILESTGGAGWVPGWAYETEAGMPIEVGSVPIPEPSGSLLAGLGFGFLAFRRKR